METSMQGRATLEELQRLHAALRRTGFFILRVEGFRPCGVVGEEVEVDEDIVVLALSV